MPKIYLVNECIDCPHCLMEPTYKPLTKPTEQEPPKFLCAHPRFADLPGAMPVIEDEFTISHFCPLEDK